MDGAPVATKLAATLSPKDTKEDVWLEWVSFAEKLRVLYSRRGAWIYSANLGAGVVAAGLFCACVFAVGDAARRHHRARLSRAALALGVATTLLAYLLVPKTEVRLVRSPVSMTKQGYYSLWMSLIDMKPSSRDALSAEAGRILANPTNDTESQAWAESGRFQVLENYLVGGRLREEDSPGNFIIREAGEELEFVVFDSDGGESGWGQKWRLHTQP